MSVNGRSAQQKYCKLFLKVFLTPKIERKHLFLPFKIRSVTNMKFILTVSTKNNNETESLHI